MAFLALILGAQQAGAQPVLEQARQLERAGDALRARQLLQRAVRATPSDAAVLGAWAEFLDRYRDPEARRAYRRLLEVLPESDRERRALIARRLAALDLLAGDRVSARQHWGIWQRAEGRVPGQPPFDRPAPPEPEVSWIEIPGPLPSFLRMAAVSQDVTVEELLPALARNVVTNGYRASASGEALEPTEYMKLLQRYLSQARELEKLAGPERTIRIEACESPRTGELLRVLGYRIRGACGSELVLETVNATRAFLTIDSGFPLAELEQALRTNQPFVYDYRSTKVPVLYGPEYWLTGRERSGLAFIDVFLGDPALCRLYLGFSKLDRETADALRRGGPAERLRPFGHVLDFFGGMFQIRNGRAIVPGAPRTEKVWAELVGVAPEQGAAFFERLLTRDDGWLASYFDALARVNGPVREYLTEPERLRRFYLAVRGRITSPGPARPVFRSNTDMLLLTTRRRLEPDGRPHIPGGLEIWKNLFLTHPHGKLDTRLARAPGAWRDADDLLEAMFALCRRAVENEPLKIFMALSDLNRRRLKPLEPGTVDRLARAYRAMSAQYSLFAEAPSLSDATILLFLDTAEAINRIGDPLLRANVAGTMQALASLWQIFCRHGFIPEPQADRTLAELIQPFGQIREAHELFDAGRAGVERLLAATGSAKSAAPQERMMELLAGVSRSLDPETENRIIEEMMRLFEAQRLLPLNLLFEVADHLEAVARGERVNATLLNRLSARLGEMQLPRAVLSTVERNAFAYGYWTERHIEAQRRLNLRASVERAAGNPARVRELRGLLAPLLRDTLVGLNYIHYAPPGGQLLLTNPLFVRSHDFIGGQGARQTWRQTEVFGTGWPSNAGGRLEGSLAGLPYALAEAEQNFMVPEREQALIWGDLVPQLVLSAKIPRWWTVTPAQMHWVGLHLRFGEAVLAEAAFDARRREQLEAVLERQASPGRSSRILELVASGEVQKALEEITPGELFVLAADVLARDGAETSALAREIRALQREFPDRINYGAIARLFGTPKPTLTTSYQPDLLHLRTFPTLMGYSSRIMAESWESSTLFWAALADELHLAPAQLNLAIPEWTQKTVEKIFATHLEDWPALWRSMRMVAEDVRARVRGQLAGEQQASLQ
ncbi:MAG: hypothetical protein RMI94_06465 [Bryobacterales bacterium]|nr:hypothetical protein [Bryobacterales bacterium]